MLLEQFKELWRSGNSFLLLSLEFSSSNNIGVFSDVISLVKPVSKPIFTEHCKPKHQISQPIMNHFASHSDGPDNRDLATIHRDRGEEGKKFDLFLFGQCDVICRGHEVDLPLAKVAPAIL